MKWEIFKDFEQRAGLIYLISSKGRTGCYTGNGLYEHENRSRPTGLKGLTRMVLLVVEVMKW